jgi:hypothetical protein
VLSAFFVTDPQNLHYLLENTMIHAVDHLIPGLLMRLLNESDEGI